jgi:hypothetical protein
MLATTGSTTHGVRTNRGNNVLYPDEFYDLDIVNDLLNAHRELLCDETDNPIYLERAKHAKFYLLNRLWTLYDLAYPAKAST